MTDRQTDGRTDRRTDRRTGENNMSPDPEGGDIIKVTPPPPLIHPFWPYPLIPSLEKNQIGHTNPGRFGPGSFRPWVVSANFGGGSFRRFGLGRWVVSANFLG